MKKYLNFVIAGLFMFSLFGLVSAENTQITVVSATVEPAQISFSVPELIEFGQITQGYNSEEVNFSVINNGETDIRVEASLEEDYPENGIFNNLKFKKDGTVTARTLSSFYLTIDKPEESGGNTVQGASIWLDLTKYTESLTESFDEEVNLIFTAMPN